MFYTPLSPEYFASIVDVSWFTTTLPLYAIHKKKNRTYERIKKRKKETKERKKETDKQRNRQTKKQRKKKKKKPDERKKPILGCMKFICKNKANLHEGTYMLNS